MVNTLVSSAGGRLDQITSLFDVEKFRAVNAEISFEEYLARVMMNPRIIRNAWQRLWEMVYSKGTEKIVKYRKTYTHYKFFDDASIPIFGLDETIHQLVMALKGAAGHYGVDRRIILLHGPVGSAKSTICRRLKRGFEKYTNSPEGEMYTYKWVGLPTGDDGIYIRPDDMCVMNEDPLKLIPIDLRPKLMKELNATLREQTSEEDRKTLYSLRMEDDLNPRCRKFMHELLKRNDGNLSLVLKNHIKVVRLVASEADRVAIATFQPKDEKNQDSTELTGDINYREIAHYGKDSDPRAFNFDGELCVANRGPCELIEMLKLGKEFLYDFLGASQEKQIKPKKIGQIPIDLALLGHTNGPEFQRLIADNTQEAIRNRMVKVDVPYQLEWSNETAILNSDYGPTKVNQHIAPHTLSITALVGILSRLEHDKENNLSLMDKAKLYDGQSLPGFTEDSVKELKDKHPDEGMKKGISCRYLQDKLSNCLASHYDYINPFMVLNELREGLDNSASITSKEDIAEYNLCIDLAGKQLDEILKDEVQQALVGDQTAIVRLCTNYIDNVMAFIDKTKVKNPITGRDEESNERLMRSIEEKIDIPSTKAEDFRRSIAAFIGGLSVKGERFAWNSNSKLEKAFKAKLFEDTKDHIKLSALSESGTSVTSPDMQEKIDALKARLIRQFGYNEQSASDVLKHVGSIFREATQH